MAELVRLQKALADAGIASRRAAESLIAEGRVTVNGRPAGIGQRVDPEQDELTVDGRRVGRPPEPVYLVLAKPAGVTSTVSDPHAERTVVDLVPEDVRRRARRIYPVGRLDADTEGLLLLTNDGDWAQRMLHPRHGVEREYAIGLARPLSLDQHRRLATGIDLDEGLATLSALRLSSGPEVARLGRLIGRAADRLTWYRATLRRGWKRQLRRMFAAVGAPVERLVRVRFGSVRLGAMVLGDVRPLDPSERRALEGLATGRHPRPGAGHRFVVSIDGPSGSGKSSVGARAAQRLGYRFCDTGVLYRGLTWLALNDGVDLDDGPALARLVEHVELAPDAEQRYVRLLARGRDVTDELHTAAVDMEVSRLSRHPEVREALLPVQRRVAETGGIVVAGRDVGTVVLPDADPKLYLDVSVEERARRRAESRGEATEPDAVALIEEDLRRRDGIDSTRAVAPLRIPDGAIVIPTDGNTLAQTVDTVVDVVEGRARELAAAEDVE